MEKAKISKAKKAQREKEVFKDGNNWNRDRTFTSPKPFNLSFVKL